MSIDLPNIIEKGKVMAERAVNEDKAKNLKIAEQAYLAAVEWFMHAIKYGKVQDPLKKEIRTKIKSYLDRAEEIHAMMKDENTPKTADKGEDEPPKKQSKAGRRDRAGNQDDDDQNRSMKRLEGAIVEDPDVSFDDVVGLEQAKVALKETVIIPVKFPELFQGKRKPWAGILLYGPPGTGKSYLAKAIATECQSTFISVTSADLLSKWVGESEKDVRCLFELARERQPCIVFIDEIDAMCGQRDDKGSESSLRVITEFLVQMDGVGTKNAGVLVLAATNIPWRLDPAIRRRFEKRIYIPLPGLNERAGMFKTNLGTGTFHTIKESEWMQLAQNSEHYSGADIALVCREALLRPIRRLSSATHFKRVPAREGASNEGKLLWLACSPGDPDAQVMTLADIKRGELFDPPVTIADMTAALITQKASVGPADLVMHQEFTDKFGQEGA